MKLTVATLLGLSSVQAVYKTPDPKGNYGAPCGTVFDPWSTTSGATTTVTCDNYLVCASLDVSAVSFAPTLTFQENVQWSSFMQGWGIPSQSAWKNPATPGIPNATTQAQYKTRLNNLMTQRGTQKLQFQCRVPTECNKTWNGAKVTCADVATSCDADCIKEKYGEFHELGGMFGRTGGLHWNECNIYDANSGCRHESKDKHYCCGVPVLENDTDPPKRVVPWKQARHGDGLCIPTDADTTDGKVTTTAYQYYNPESKEAVYRHNNANSQLAAVNITPASANYNQVYDQSTSSYLAGQRDYSSCYDTAGATCTYPRPWKQIPSQSLELECSAKGLLAATSAALALFSLV